MISPDEIIVVVQNCGNVGLAAIKTLLAKGGCKVRTASRNPDKLKTTKLKDLDVEVYKTGDDALFEGIDRFVCIAPGPKDPDMRAKVAIDFVQKAKDSGAKHGAVMSVVVAAAENRRGILEHNLVRLKTPLVPWKELRLATCELRSLWTICGAM